MLTTIEKVLTLKSVDIFSETPESALLAIAGILEEVRLSANATLFNKGDIGSSMYIVYSGSVRIHDGEKLIVKREEGQVVGEMALFDADLRSASVTAISDCLLLRLDQEPFYDILSEAQEVSRGV